jgi:16S rRNA (guanine527-N7)-methyltransferase
MTDQANLTTQTLLADGLRAWEIELTAAQRDQFNRYQTLLLDWNERMNLTAVTDPTAVPIRHFLDSLSCLLVTGPLDGQNLIDIGAGAGFPGLPLKILYPGLRLTLAESVGKKCRFLEAVITELGLENVAVLNERAEVVGRDPAHRERYDWAAARAVAALPILAEYLLPLCRVGGRMVAMKGEAAALELAATAVAQLGGGAAQLQPVALPGETSPRYLVVISKSNPTPDNYPRRAGIPAKRPLRG